MLLTIAIPAHNKSSFLNEAISSIKDEEGFGKDFDIVISDNSLNDKISELYKKKFSQNPYIEHINSKDFDSLDSNVNRSIEISKAKYVWIFGDDDILVPGITKTIVNFLKQNHPDLLVLNSQSFRDSELIEYFSSFSPLYWVALASNSLPSELLSFPSIDQYSAVLKDSISISLSTMRRKVGD